MAETNVMAVETSDKVVTRRNYQLDFLKFIFTLLVFWCHTNLFIGENTRVKFPLMLAEVSVHFFFVVSGLLMVNSIMKSAADTSGSGKSAIRFVLKKFKGMSLQYWTALFIFTAIYSGKLGNPIREFFAILYRIFPEAFLVSYAGVRIDFNGPTWYLSAMFIVMLPLAYLLYKRKDFFLYIFSPLTAIFSMGYLYQVNNHYFGGQGKFYGIVLGGIIRALCGLCFGVVAWLIYSKLSRIVRKKSQIILLTVIETLIWVIFFSAWFIVQDEQSTMSVLLLLPIAIAIAFSGKSYIYRMFGLKWMKYLSSVSLAIYLNHFIARYVVKQCFSGCSYKFGISMMALFTAASCLIYYVIMKLCRSLWNKKLKKVFSNQEGYEIKV